MFPTEHDLEIAEAAGYLEFCIGLLTWPLTKLLQRKLGTEVGTADGGTCEIIKWSLKFSEALEIILRCWDTLFPTSQLNKYLFQKAKLVENLDPFGDSEYRHFHSNLEILAKLASVMQDTLAMKYIARPRGMQDRFGELARQRQREPKDYDFRFTYKEDGGKFMDLEKHHIQCRLLGIRTIDYITYLSTFDSFSDIPRKKKNYKYRYYLENLMDYLFLFSVRVKPRVDHGKLLSRIEATFYHQCETNSVPGWPTARTGSALAAKDSPPLDLSAFTTWEELAALGLDRLKSTLMALGMKCGGTLEERAKRLLATKGKKRHEIDADLFVKKKDKARDVARSLDAEEQKIALLETKICRLTELLSEQRAATIQYAARTSTYGQWDKEARQQQSSIATTESDLELAEMAGHLRFSIVLLTRHLNHFLQRKLGNQRRDLNLSESIDTILGNWDTLFPACYSGPNQSDFAKVKMIHQCVPYQYYECHAFQNNLEKLAHIASATRDADNKIEKYILRHRNANNRFRKLAKQWEKGAVVTNKRSTKLEGTWWAMFINSHPKKSALIQDENLSSSSSQVRLTSLNQPYRADD